MCATLARELGLAVAEKGESYEICFVPNGDYAAFMDAYLREQGSRGPTAAARLSLPRAARLASMPACTTSPSGQRKGLGYRDG